jgi:hypothetical protein
MRTLFSGVVLVGLVAVVGCGKKAPSCDEAVNGAMKAYGETDPAIHTKMVAECGKDKWSGDLRACMAAATDKKSLRACHDFDTPKSAGSKTDMASMTAKKYAFEAYPSWSVANPDSSCPGSLADLEKYMDGKGGKDPWGNDYKMFCGANMPAGAHGMAVLSFGEDGKEGTADDVKSWE